jgi:hypothetical protein
MKEKRLIEALRNAEIQLIDEATTDGAAPKRTLRVRRAMTSGIINGNGRRYPSQVIEAAVQELRTHLHESGGQGRLLGEAEHPSDKGGRPNLMEVVVKWTDVEFDGRDVSLTGNIIETSKGRDIQALMLGGVLPGVSLRGYGASKLVKDGAIEVEEVTALRITGFDLVMEPSFAEASAVLESKHTNASDIEAMESNEMSLKVTPETEQAKATAPTPDAAPAPTNPVTGTSGYFTTTLEAAPLNLNIEGAVAEAVKKALAEVEAARKAEDAARAAQAQGVEEQRKREEAARVEERRKVLVALGLPESANIEEALAQRETERKAMQEAEQRRAVEAHVVAAIAALPYEAELKAQIGESLRGLNPRTVEEATAQLEAQRKTLDAVLAHRKLVSMGRSGSVEVLGPVIERATGYPEFARVSFELNESLNRAGLGRQWDARKPSNTNQRVAARYLEMFDKKYKHKLLAEAREFAEAETTSDLNLPYSVSRAVVAEAIPQLVAISVFDYDFTDLAPARIFFEDYSDESGATATVTDEVVTGDHDTWVNLANNRLQPGTVVLTNSGASTTYTEGTDYVIDYGKGRIMTLSAGTTTDAQSLKIDYTYDAIRLGENVAIKQGKETLTYETLEIEADRLAAEITREAVVFSQSQIGWDATNRTLVNLIRRINESIDRDLFREGIAAALSVASNSGGTWTAASDSLDILIKYIGVAKTKVMNNYYTPTAVVMSATNSDRLSNSTVFTADGMRPDADLNAAGYVGRIKALPVFESTQFPDSYILVCNRELVQHRVFTPMAINGPYQGYSSGALKATQLYYVEEFNGSAAFRPRKGSYVKVA